MSTGVQETAELKEDIAATITVQEGDGCLTMTIPKRGAEALAIDGGDTVLVTGEAGEEKLCIRKFSPALLES